MLRGRDWEMRKENLLFHYMSMIKKCLTASRLSIGSLRNTDCIPDSLGLFELTYDLTYSDACANTTVAQHRKGRLTLWLVLNKVLRSV